MMSLRFEEFGPDTLVAVMTWALLLFLSVTALVGQDASFGALGIVLALFLSYLVALLALATRRLPSRRRAGICLGIELLSAGALFFLLPFDYLAILMVIWSAQVSWFLPLSAATVAALAGSLPFLASRLIAWAPPADFLPWLLFAAFNLFAAVMMQLVRREQRANAALQEANEALESARDMLSEAGREAEKLRLAGVEGATVREEPLSDVEKDLLRLAASGCSNRRIADILHKSEGTIKNRFTVIFGKLGVADRTQAVVKALHDGLLESPR